MGMEAVMQLAVTIGGFAIPIFLGSDWLKKRTTAIQLKAATAIASAVTELYYKRVKDRKKSGVKITDAEALEFRKKARQIAAVPKMRNAEQNVLIENAITRVKNGGK